MQRALKDEACIILTSVASRMEAMTIAEKLVEAGLAACVQISAQGDAVYRWQGSVQQSHEHFLSVKTTRARKQAAIEWLQSHHPYELPEILCLNAEAGSAYLEWMRATTTADMMDSSDNSPQKPTV